MMEKFSTAFLILASFSGLRSVFLKYFLRNVEKSKKASPLSWTHQNIMLATFRPYMKYTVYPCNPAYYITFQKQNVMH